MKTSDIIAAFLLWKKIDTVFGLQGGAVVHLWDSAEQAGIRCIYCHHEQAAAFAAVAWAKVTGKCGCCIVTSGPGGTNAMTGCLSAYQDSVPVLFLSGQTRLEHCSYGKPVRQVGNQEARILSMVAPITVFSKLVKPLSIADDLRSAFTAATDGRKGPSWLDIPVNIGWAHV
jgi:acetolactate synthase-1/2/3 large subunit